MILADGTSLLFGPSFIIIDINGLKGNSYAGTECFRFKANKEKGLHYD